MLNSIDELDFLSKNEIGEGAYSKVYHVKHRETKKHYALKHVNVFKICKEDCQNLRNEIKIHQSLKHPHIIDFVDCLQVGFLYLFHF
jgi:NIMA (never in mitosis gene a)-related kinase